MTEWPSTDVYNLTSDNTSYPTWPMLSEQNNNTAEAAMTSDEFYAYHRPAISLVDKYMTPVWYVIGFPSNLLAFSVWIQPSMRPSSGCYLAGLAMSDFIFLILQVLYELQQVWHYRVFEYPFLCQTFPVIFYASQYLSPLLVLGFTVERYISICHPFQREKYCSTSRAIKVIICLVIFSIVLHVIQAYFWVFDAQTDSCSPRPEVIRGGSRSVWTVWSWITELLVFGLVPVAILVLNIRVIKETKRLSKSQETRMCVKQKGHKSSAATITLLAVSFYLIFTTLPVTVVYALHFSFPPGDSMMSNERIEKDSTWQRHFNYYTLKTVIQEFGMSHYACNFFIYVLTGKVFRKALKILCFRVFCKEKLEHLRQVDFAREMSQSLRGNADYRRISADTRKSNDTNGTLSSFWATGHREFAWRVFLYLTRNDERLLTGLHQATLSSWKKTYKTGKQPPCLPRTNCPVCRSRCAMDLEKKNSMDSLSVESFAHVPWDDGPKPTTTTKKNKFASCAAVSLPTISKLVCPKSPDSQNYLIFFLKPPSLNCWQCFVPFASSVLLCDFFISRLWVLGGSEAFVLRLRYEKKSRDN